MANPLWKVGMKSVNPTGRPKASFRSVKGLVERFVIRNITPNKLQKMYDTLNEKDKLNMLTELLPYVAAKQSSVDGLSASDVDKLHDELIKAIQSNDKARAV